MQNRKQSTKKQKQKSSINNSASRTPVQGPSTVACMIVTIIITFPLISSGPLQWVKASENTNLHTKFLLQFLKQWEDSTMLLASNKQQHKRASKKQKNKRRKDKLHRKGQQRRTKTKWTYKKLPTYRVTRKNPNAKISKKNFSLLSNPLVLFNRILKGQPLFFRSTIRLTI
jgi:hypothetical protein